MSCMECHPVLNVLLPLAVVGGFIFVLWRYVAKPMMNQAAFNNAYWERLHPGAIDLLDRRTAMHNSCTRYFNEVTKHLRKQTASPGPALEDWYDNAVDLKERCERYLRLISGWNVPELQIEAEKCLALAETNITLSLAQFSK